LFQNGRGRQYSAELRFPAAAGLSDRP
jgi:hypothetical protein